MEKEAFGRGRIHDTYLIKDTDGSPARILQRINTAAFADPTLLMNNLQQVTDFIREKGGETLEFLPFDDGSLLQRKDGGWWRQTRYIESDVYDRSDDPEILREAGRSFGGFAALLEGFPGELPQTIPDFHNTKKHLQDCFAAARKDPCGRAEEAKPLLELLEKLAPEICTQYDAICRVSPLRLTHNDTKLSNILFKKESKQALCVIDLDTVMPGLLLYDFADGARSVSLTPVPGQAAVFSEENYQAFLQGYLEGAGTLLSAEEKALTGTAFRTVCAELGARYLEDFLCGDRVFKVTPPDSTYLRAESLLRFLSAKKDF